MWRILSFIRQHPIFIIVIVLLAYFAGWIMAGEGAITNEDAATNAQSVVSSKKNTKKTMNASRKAPIVESAKIEDASSTFVANRLSDLPKAEYKIYGNTFYAAMQSPGGKSSWHTASGFGAVQAGEPYITQMNVTCRNFSERYTVKKQTQIFSGIACKNSKGGWCKLRGTSTPTCALNDEGGLGSFFGGTMIDMHNFGIGADNIKYRIQRMLAF